MIYLESNILVRKTCPALKKSKDEQKTKKKIKFVHIYEIDEDNRRTKKKYQILCCSQNIECKTGYERSCVFQPMLRYWAILPTINCFICETVSIHIGF